MRPCLRDLGKEALHLVLGDRFLWRLPAGRRALALTFDDGPDPDHTAPMLDLLAKLDVRATFFLIGRHVARHPALARRIAAEGHALAGHTYDHQEIVSLPPQALGEQMESCRRAIQDAAAVDTRWFRPPRGRMSLPALRRVAALGYRTVHWTRTYSDYQRDGTAPLLARMTGQAPAARDIILLHDHNPHTIEALGTMIPRWRAEGLGFECL